MACNDARIKSAFLQICRVYNFVGLDGCITVKLLLKKQGNRVLKKRDPPYPIFKKDGKVENRILYCCFPFVSRPYPDNILERIKKNLPISDITRLCLLKNRCDHFFLQGIRNNYLYLDFRDKIDLIFTSSIDFYMPFLPAKTLYIRN